jgi:hypothetical protein
MCNGRRLTCSSQVLRTALCLTIHHILWMRALYCREYRRRFHLPSYLAGWEILAVEIEKYRIQQGWEPKTSDDLPYSVKQ